MNDIGVCNGCIGKTGDTLQYCPLRYDCLRYYLFRSRIDHKTMNDVWEKRLDLLLDYYRRNRIDVSPEDFEFTFLLDEPDRNLDIDNIESLINILSFHKERTQLITVIHNPLVIWRLSDNKSVNFVEMTEGYVEKVRNVIEKGRRYGK